MACSRAPEPTTRIFTPPSLRPAVVRQTGVMATIRIPVDQGRRAVAAVRGVVTDAPDARADLATATRYLLQELARANPGRTVEVRVPPFGAVQCIEGPRHTRGTPANVVECDPMTWVALATGDLEWAEALGTGRVSASGTRSDISDRLPLKEW